MDWWTDRWTGGRSPHCVHAHRQKLHEADLELQRKREYIEELEPPTDSSSKWGPAARARGALGAAWNLGALVCSSTARRIEELQDSLQRKDADLRAMEERYRRYVDKARTVRMLGVWVSCLRSCSECFPSANISAFTPVTPYRVIS